MVVSAETQRKRIADFFGRERQRLVGYVQALIADTTDRDAEDVVQDVMESVFERADITEPISDLSSYLYRSLRNRIVDLYRRPKRAAELATEIEDLRYESSEAVGRKEEMDTLFSAIDKLPSAQREVLLATEFEGRGYRELSEQWDTPMGTLLARKHRAVRALRRALQGGTT
jgi:RNA polymerase sigma factor (sigma-70 family)